MTADMELRGFAPLMHAASIACIMNAFFRDRGGRRDIAPPSRIAIIIIKMQLFFS